MKLAVLGAGAIGGVIGGYASRAGRDVTLIDPWPENVERIKEHGLTVTAEEEEFTAHPAALHLGELSAARQKFDAVFLSVKSYDTEWASKFIEPYLEPGGFIVSAQNSINDDVIAGIVGWPRVVGCVVTIGAGMYEPGHALRTSANQGVAFKVGELSGRVTPRVTAICDVLGAVGLSQPTTNLWGERWAKLSTNCMFNALAGITGLTSQQLRAEPRTRDTIVRIAAEVVEVATTLGVSVEPIGGIKASTFGEALKDGRVMEDLSNELVDRGGHLREGRPSLAQDLMKGRATEIDYLNGLIARRGVEVGVETPVNAAVVNMTKRIESGELAQSVDNMDVLGSS